MNLSKIQSGSVQWSYMKKIGEVRICFELKKLNDAFLHDLVIQPSPIYGIKRAEIDKKRVIHALMSKNIGK